MIRRRDFITLLGGAAFAWPLTARAQQRERMRRIGVLASNLTADDPEWQVRSNTFVQGLQERGWSDGRNVRIDNRWGLGDSDRLRKYAAELVALAPDVILAAGSIAVRVAVIRNPANPDEIAQFGAIQAMAPSLGVELTPIIGRNPGVIERDVRAFARGRGDGLIVAGAGAQKLQRDTIIAVAAHHQLPAVYPFRGYVAQGGLISYGIDQAEGSAREIKDLAGSIKSRRRKDGRKIEAPRTHA